MNFRLFYHSLVSDWNHGNAHFLRGVVSELLHRGHAVRVFEPRDGWSRRNLLADDAAALEEFACVFPQLTSELYDAATLDLDRALDGADVVLVHEWTDAEVLSAIADHHTRGGKYRLLFHDTHHRAVSDPDALAEMPLERFDGVLAFGASLAECYQRLGWGRRVWVWHEAADVRITQIRKAITQSRHPQITQIAQISQISQLTQDDDDRGDVVWVGNWGDDERAREIEEYLIEPVRRLQLRARVHGVRYPPDALDQLRSAGIEYAGWVPNYRVPEVFAQCRATVHIPRGPYVSLLPGIPTIRVFEALACGIPLISAPWDDREGLFRPGDFLMVQSGDEMAAALRKVISDQAFAAELAARGKETVYARHTCGYRVDELMAILEAMDGEVPAAVSTSEEV